MEILWRKKENEMNINYDGAEIDRAENVKLKRNLENAEKAYNLLSLHHNALLIQNMELRSARAKSCWWCRLKYAVKTFRSKEE
jgi:hypothetical protein